MDQPTGIEIRIIGKSMDVKRAALAAQRRIDLDTRGFEEEKYIFGDGSDFEEKIEEAVGILGDYNFDDNEDGTAEYHTEQESYACIEEGDIKGIAEDIVKTSPDVEFHMTAVITVTEWEGYDVCVDADYVNGELNVDVSEEYYENFDEDEEGFDEDEEGANSNLPDGYMEALQMFMMAEELGAPKQKHGEVISSKGTFDIVIAKAEAGDAEAKFTAGKYFIANNIDEEKDRAIKWIREAAKAGIEEATEYISKHKDLEL